MRTETMREFGDRVRATIDGWSERQQRDRVRLIARWSGAAEEMFWAGQFGQEVTDEMREAVYEAGEAVLNA